MYAPEDPLNEVEQVSYVIKKFDIFMTLVLLNKSFSKYQIHHDYFIYFCFLFY